MTFLVVEIESGSQSKISQLHLEVFIEKEIAQFQISVYNSMMMKVLECIHDLVDVILRFELRNSLSPFAEIIEGLVGTELQ